MMLAYQCLLLLRHHSSSSVSRALSRARRRLPLARLFAAGQVVDMAARHEEQPTHDRQREQSQGLIQSRHSASVVKLARIVVARRYITHNRVAPTTTGIAAPIRNSTGPPPLTIQFISETSAVATSTNNTLSQPSSSIKPSRYCSMSPLRSHDACRLAP